MQAGGQAGGRMDTQAVRVQLSGSQHTSQHMGAPSHGAVGGGECASDAAAAVLVLADQLQVEGLVESQGATWQAQQDKVLGQGGAGGGKGLAILSPAARPGTGQVHAAV